MSDFSSFWGILMKSHLSRTRGCLWTVGYFSLLWGPTTTITTITSQGKLVGKNQHRKTVQELHNSVHLWFGFVWSPHRTAGLWDAPQWKLQTPKHLFFPIFFASAFPILLICLLPSSLPIPSFLFFPHFLQPFHLFSNLLSLSACCIVYQCLLIPSNVLGAKSRD